MAADQTQISLLLRGMTIFQELREDEIARLASQFETLQLGRGDRLYSEGDAVEDLYILFSGKIRLSLERGDQEIVIKRMVPGDYFGQESLLQNVPSTFTAMAEVPSEMLRLDLTKFSALVERYPGIQHYLESTIETDLLIIQKQLDWLGEDEVVYLLTRKDKAYLYLSLVGPLLLGWSSLIFFYWSATTQIESIARVTEWAGIGLIVAAALWAIWLWIDWTNDYYFVTSQRVIWQERIVGLYESRQEAPLDTILSVEINSSLIERLLRMGRVIVRTFTGRIPMRKVGRPEIMAGLIEEMVTRRRHEIELQESAALQQAIRDRLGAGLTLAEQTEAELAGEVAPPETAPTSAIAAENPFRFLLDIFKLRYEEKGIVTYRKHWILLVDHLWQPTLGLGLVILVVGARLFELYTFPSRGVLLLAALFGLIGLGLWWVYEYVDWRNDIYQVTPEHIVDIYRKPLSKEDRKSAPLENILSLHHERKGLLGILLNYGDVIAMVGTTPFTFDGVYNPAEVQQDIFLRIDAYKKRQRQVQTARERERIVDWLAAYHEQAEAVRQEQNSANQDENSG